MSDPQAQSMIFDNLRRNIGNIGNAAIQKMVKANEDKQALQDKIKAALIEGVVGGKIQAKPGVDLSNLNNIDTNDIGSVLGQMGKNFTPVKTPATTTSINYSQVPFSDIKAASDVLGRTPDQYAAAGMADPNPDAVNILGWNTGRKKGTGFMGMGFGPGSQKAPPILNSTAQSIQNAARRTIQNPTRKTINQRISGTFAGQPASSAAGEIPAELGDPSQYQEGTLVDVNGKQYKVEDGEWAEA